VLTTYSYDMNDRMLTSTQNGVTTTYGYDDNGNTLSQTVNGDDTNFGYDARNKLISAVQYQVSSPVSNVYFQYDIDGNRTRKTDNGNIINFVVDRNQSYAQVVQETNDQNATQVTYTYGDDLISQDRSASINYYNYDGLGSTRSLTDSLGQITDTYDYNAYGTLLNQTGASTNNYLYTGEQYDPALKDYYLRARYYDPANGRFTQMDSFTGFDQDPITLHKYLYGNGNPINNVDPSGNISTLQSVGVALGILSTLVLTNVLDTGLNLFADAGDQISDKLRGAIVVLNLSSGSNKQLMLLYKKANKKITLRNSQAEIQMLDRKDVDGYYTSRLSRGDGYASLALDVVRNQGALGSLANFWLFRNVVLNLSEEQKKKLMNGGSYSDFVRRVNIALASLHAENVDSDFSGIYGLLSSSQIRKYHENYFETLGLPKRTFGGSWFFGIDLWCTGCDVEH